MTKNTYDLHANWLENELSKMAPDMEWKVKSWDEGALPTTYKVEASIEIGRGHLWVFTWDAHFNPVNEHSKEYVQWILYRIAYQMAWKLMGIKLKDSEVSLEPGLGTEQPKGIGR